MDPKTAKVTEKGGLKLTKAEDGKYTAEVEFEQKLKLVSELLGHDKVEKEVTIGAEDKTEALTMAKSKVSISILLFASIAKNLWYFNYSFSLH